MAALPRPAGGSAPGERPAGPPHGTPFRSAAGRWLDRLVPVAVAAVMLLVFGEFARTLLTSGTPVASWRSLIFFAIWVPTTLCFVLVVAGFAGWLYVTRKVAVLDFATGPATVRLNGVTVSALTVGARCWAGSSTSSRRAIPGIRSPRRSEGRRGKLP